ncbi:hypothetical protein GCM10007907_30170 [Chitinimonas prasina]|uniref:SMI1/KNR4 family protein n=1 Tax=Chitinimonas prasina TaxID=1434937 RepID=A0ABQ5YI96_9NEIS|nr:hypothetical protein [Chitinimonas prasina]GLR14227.1 hypothetical protein GCM10007907_30170 [Chitinimonas prasina]
MISHKLVAYFKSKNWWFDEETDAYKVALLELGISLESDIAAFFLHAEDGPNFIGSKGEILQLCWHIINTDYLENSESLKKSLGLPTCLILLTSSEGGGGYFYNKDTCGVLLIELGKPP